MAREFVLAACVLACLLARAASMGSGGVCTVSFDETAYTVDEGGMRNVTVTIEPMGSSLINNISVNISSGGGTAVSGTDYTPVSGELMFTNSSRQQTVHIQTVNDTIVEEVETLVLSLSTMEMMMVSLEGPVTVSIIDQTRVRVVFDTPAYTVEEGASVDVVATVMNGTLDRGLIMVTTTRSGGTAEDTDFTGLHTALTFDGDNLSRTFSIMAVADDVVEDRESFDIFMSTTDPAVSGFSTTNIAIIDNTTLVIGFDKTQYSVIEGETVMATLTAMTALDREVDVTLQSSGSTDFSIEPANVIFNSTTSTRTVVINATFDVEAEGEEMFTISLNSAVSLAPLSVSVKIIDATIFGFRKTSYSFPEGEIAVMMVYVNQSSVPRPFNATIMSVDGTAIGVADFVPVDETRYVNTTVSSFEIMVVVNEDAMKEGDESFSVVLSTNTAGVAPAPDATTATITITDTTVSVTVDPGVLEVVEGQTQSLTMMTTDTVVESFTLDLSAGGDVVIVPARIMFTPSNRSHTVSITPMEDEEVEGNEMLALNIFTSAPFVAVMNQIILVVDRTIIITEQPQSQGVMLNDSVTLTCVFEAGYNMSIVWMKDGTNLSTGINPTTTALTPGFSHSSTLTIDRVAFSDCGTYVCSMGGATTSAELGVFDLFSTSDLNPKSSVGAVDTLSCSIRSCGPPFSIIWSVNKDNGTLQPFPIDVNVANTSMAGVMETRSEVTINTLGVRNEGEAQQCEVWLSGASVRNQTFNYTLENVEVEVAVSPENRTGGSFIQNDTVVLNCSASNPPGVNRNLTFTWVRSTEYPINLTSNPTDDMRVEAGDGYVALLFPEIQDDLMVEGNYTCRVHNRQPQDGVYVTVEVDVISGPLVTFPNAVTVVVGENETITCDTTGSNPPVTLIVIRRGGVEVARDVNMTKLSYTIANPTLSDHLTEFECIATNSIGNTSEAFNLTVIAPPDAVGSDTITSTIRSLLVSTITWTAPAYNNAPITGYNISLWSSETRVWEFEGTSEPSITVRLSPNVQYNVSVVATNDAGSSTSDTAIIMGAENGANATVTATIVTTEAVFLNFTLSNLVVNISDVKGNGNFFVERFEVSRYGMPVSAVTTKSFLDRVEDDNLLYNVTVVYSDPEINNNLNTVTIVSVMVPGVVPVPVVNQVPREPPKNKTDTTNNEFGFSFAWNPPEAFKGSDLLTGYNVVIERLSFAARRRRQTNIVRNMNVTKDTTSYVFDAGDIAYTDFRVRVDGIVTVNRVTARVVALDDTMLRTGQGRPSAPENIRTTSVGTNSLGLAWEEPDNPRGPITKYSIVLVSPMTSEESDATSVVVRGLRANTQYTVTVYAMNGDIDGDQASAKFNTSYAVSRPEITVSTNEAEVLYTVRIKTFSDLFGPLSHYEVYAVIVTTLSDTPPDTSTIKGSTDDEYVAAAGLASIGPDITINIGNGIDGKVSLPGGGSVAYDNKAVRRGTTYFFFVRLYSGVDANVYNDSLPQTSQRIPETNEENNPTVAIIAGILGALAFLLIIVLLILVIFALRGRISDSYKVPHLRRLEDGEKGGIELRRRTRHFTPVLDVGDPNAFTSAGQPTTLVCEVSGTPAPTIKWSHEGKPLDDERFLVLADHSLFIQNTSLEDEGSYLVTAENSTGASTAQIKVTVIKPTPPERDGAHPLVQVDNFPEYYARITANEGDDLEEEYQDVEPDFANTAYAAKLSINRNKNRYINIIPYDHSRVVLALQDNTPGSDYVNASYIDGFKKTNQYIATQGPTTTTLADFWRMVWEFDCPTIVMVTKLEEEDKRKCEQYWPSYGSTTYGNVQVTLKEAENLAEYSIRTFSISPLAGQSSSQMPVREVKQFHFLKWPDHGVPNYATALLHFRKRVHQYHPMQRGPMIVHCSAGVGRTGTFITVDYSMERMEGEGSVDIFNFVQQMRYKRNYMVQTAPQYEFIHEAINEAITCGDTSIKAPELKEWLGKLTPDPETGKTVLEEQFKRLDSASPHDEEFDCTVAEVNKDKNRVNKHLPANDQRVVLSTEDDMCDYICASYVDGYRQRNAFMITQGPMEDTVGDFWRMVWELKSAAIVMLTQLEEDGEEMSRKYWSDTVGEAAVFGLFHVELTSEVRELGDYCTRKIKLSPISKPQESRIVTQFHFTKWSRSVPPETAKPMIDMIDELQRVQRKSGNQPITVHCNDGLGRTGAFCTLYYVLDRVKTEQVVDVFQAVKTLRIQRTGLVENLDQFKFVHTATMEFLNTFSDYQNFK